MDLLLLLIRIITYSITLYLLLEFIVVCRVSTTIGIYICLGATAIVVLSFILLKRYDVIICQTCKQYMPKKLFNLPISK